MKSVRNLCVWAGAAVLAASAGAASRAPKPETIRVASFGRSLPFVMAQKHDFFAKYGIQVEMLPAPPSSDALRAQIESGEADIAHAAVDNAVALNQPGKPRVVVVVGGELSLNVLIAQPDIPSIAALRGHITIVDAANTAFALQLIKILQAHGLHAGRDYKLLPIATTGKRYQLMLQNKDYAATMLFPPFSIEAKQHGFVELAAASTYTGPYQSVGGWVRISWARAHADLLERYLAAFIEGQRWVLDPAHKQEILQILSQHLSPAVAEETYAAMVAKTGGQLEPDARLNTEAFRNVLKLRAEIEGSWGGKVPPIGRYYDPVYYEKALSLSKK